MMTNCFSNGAFTPWSNGFAGAPSNGCWGPQSGFNGCSPAFNGFSPSASFGYTAPGAWNNGFGGGFGGQYPVSGFGHSFPNGFANSFSPAASAMWAWYQNSFCANPADCSCTPGNTTCFTMPGCFGTPGAWSAPGAYPFGASNFSGGSPWNYGMNGGMNGGFNNAFPFGHASNTWGFNTPYSYSAQNCNPYPFSNGGWNGFSGIPTNFSPAYGNWSGYGAPAYTPGFNAGFNSPGFNPAHNASFNPWWSAAGAFAPNFNPFHAGAPAYPGTPWNSAQGQDPARYQNPCTNGTMNLKRDAA